MCGFLHMQMSLQKEIRWIAALFRDSGYRRIARQCNKMSKNLSIYKKSPQKLQADINKLVSTFDLDYVHFPKIGSKELRTEYLLIIQELHEMAMLKSPDFNETVAEILPFVMRGMDTSEAITHIARIWGNFDNERFHEINFYLSLFMFMLHIEGQYFPVLKALCALKLVGEGKNIDFETVDKMSYERIKRELRPIGEPLFLVYDDIGRKLRNAVAHASFRFDKGKLVCWNIEPRTRKRTWKKDFTFEELTTTFADIYGVAWGYINWYIVRQLIGKIQKFASSEEVQ